MSLRSRPAASRQTSISDMGDTATTTTTGDGYTPPETPRTPQSSFTQRAISQTLTTTANLANLLPTGTLLAFQLLTPIFTNNASCDAATRPMTFILLALLAASCFLACFTDSYKSDKQVYYGLATFKGMWLFDYQAAAASSSGIPDLSKFKLGTIDWVHAVVSVFVFVAMALRDKNVQNCFYPKTTHEIQEFSGLMLRNPEDET
ncbi:hypothetical protein F0562_020252 [Nyssa sinensis]|uniref:Uncharacterized protein n=1 Tax=Nyssa sinensis TaxID=561372 RepID=A0A5J5BRF7_9ASTE|nr:hypothetical protein F0562_020252 [Nyssa sinensis]